MLKVLLIALAVVSVPDLLTALRALLADWDHSDPHRKAR